MIVFLAKTKISDLPFLQIGAVAPKVPLLHVKVKVFEMVNELVVEYGINMPVSQVIVAIVPSCCWPLGAGSEKGTLSVL